MTKAVFRIYPRINQPTTSSAIKEIFNRHNGAVLLVD
jgi:hypothetical protein